MERFYEIPGKGEGRLDVGQWVEIFEAYGRAEEGAIRVRSMRVDGQSLTFAGEVRKHRRERSLHPHEGRIVYVEEGSGGTRFGIRLDS